MSVMRHWNRLPKHVWMPHSILEVCKARLDGTLSKLMYLKVPMAGVMDLDDLGGPFQPNSMIS